MVSDTFEPARKEGKATSAAELKQQKKNVYTVYNTG